MEIHDEGSEEFEELLAACIEGYGREGGGAIDAVCAAHPAHAERLRARLRDLDRLGLLGSPNEGLPERIGPYRILRRLGQGGMSEVFLARDERLERVVALKSAHAGLAANPRSRERFSREIEAIAQVPHPAIIPIHDAGEFEGRAYFTMEFVDGLTLAQLLEELRARRVAPGAIDPAQLAQLAGAEEGAERRPGSPWSRSYLELVARWTLQVAEALTHAHKAGIVHRDVKPSNIMLRPDGHVQLFDFGLARFDDQPGLTQSGEFTGTPYYVSPEQLTGGSRSVDARSDIYSLGVTLYELLTLHRPFEGRSTAEVLHGIQSREALPPRKLNERISRDLELICQTAIDRDRGRRYGSMSAFADDLRSFLAFEPVAAKPLGPLQQLARLYRYRPALAVAYTLAIVIAIGLPLGLLWANAEIREERDLAVQSAAEARRAAALSDQMATFLVDLFELGQGESADISARELLSRGLARIPTGRSEEPLVRAALLDTAGRVYANLGLHERALRMFDRAYARLRSEVPSEDVRLGAVLHRLARTLLETGELHSSRSIASLCLDGVAVRAGRALDEAGVARGARHREPSRPSAAEERASDASETSGVDETKDATEADGADRMQGAGHSSEAGRTNPANEPRHADGANGASETNRTSEPTKTSTLDEPRATNSSHRTSGFTQTDRLGVTPAELATSAPMLAEELADVLVTAARADERLGERARARAELTEALALREARFGPEHASCADVLARLGALALTADRVEDAIARTRRALELLEADWAPDALELATLREQLAAALVAGGRASEAVAPAERAARTHRHLEQWRSWLDQALPPLPYDYRQPWRDAYDASFQAGITALQSRRPEHAREAFEHCLELQPTNPISAYNLACSMTMLGREDEALDWLEHAVAWGFGQTATNADTLDRDVDLDPLRRSPRFERARELLMRKRAELRRAARSATAWRDGDEPRPLLVVLHGRGGDPRSCVAGEWGAVARALDAHCFVPSAVGLTGGSTLAASWYASPKDFEEHREEWSEAILDGLRPLVRDERVDPRRVWIAAEGDAGPLATSLAFESPGLWRRLVLLDSGPDPRTGRPEGRAAVLGDLRVECVVREGSASDWSPLAARERLDGVSAWFGALGIEGRAHAIGGEMSLSEVLRGE